MYNSVNNIFSHLEMAPALWSEEILAWGMWGAG